MKKIRILILGLLFFISLFFALTYGYIHFFAKDHITRILKENMDPDISIESITYTFPVGLSLKKILAPSIGSIDELRLFLSPLSCFSKNIQIRTIDLIAPKLTKPRLPSPPASNTPSQKKSTSNTSAASTQTSITISKINIQKGTLILPNSVITNIQGHAGHLTLPLKSNRSDFNLRGTMTFKETPTLLQIHGWLNWQEKNMLAKLTVMQKEKDNTLNVDLTAKDNVLDVFGVLRVASSLDQTPIPETILRALLQASSNIEETTIETKFSFQTKLDHPIITKIKFHGDVTAEEPTRDATARQ